MFLYLYTVTPNYILGKLPPGGADFFLKLRHLHAVHHPTIQGFFSTSPESMPCQLPPRQEDSQNKLEFGSEPATSQPPYNHCSSVQFSSLTESPTEGVDLSMNFHSRGLTLS